MAPLPFTYVALHCTCPRPPLLSRGCELPCVQREEVVLLLLLLFATGILLRRWVVVRHPRPIVVQRRELTSDQDRQIGVVHTHGMAHG